MDFDPKDFIAANITKSAMMEDCGLKVTNYNGDIIIYEVGGVFEMFTNVKAGSKLIKLQDKDIKDYESLEEIRQTMKDAKNVRIEAVKIKEYSGVGDSIGKEQMGQALPAGC
eukprot:Nitzschia sp. Nitz4//scaffold286_size23798//16241//16576//NITZ4_008453-RA/size23798-processed-gene-0.29-mRNA-1//-1//CDS//3329545747//4550//frame0